MDIRTPEEIVLRTRMELAEQLGPAAFQDPLVSLTFLVSEMLIEHRMVGEEMMRLYSRIDELETRLLALEHPDG